MANNPPIEDQKTPGQLAWELEVAEELRRLSARPSTTVQQTVSQNVPDTDTEGRIIATFNIYRRFDGTPDRPNSTTYSQVTNSFTVPDGWSDAIPAGDDELFLSSASVNSEESSITLSWSEPVPLEGTPGMDGEPGASVYTAFAEDISTVSGYEYSLFDTADLGGTGGSSWAQSGPDQQLSPADSSRTWWALGGTDLTFSGSGFLNANTAFDQAIAGSEYLFINNNIGSTIDTATIQAWLRLKITETTRTSGSTGSVFCRLATYDTGSNSFVVSNNSVFAVTNIPVDATGNVTVNPNMASLNWTSGFGSGAEYLAFYLSGFQDTTVELLGLSLSRDTDAWEGKDTEQAESVTATGLTLQSDSETTWTGFGPVENSLNANDYTWTETRGADGDDGTPGNSLFLAYADGFESDDYNPKEFVSPNATTAIIYDIPGITFSGTGNAAKTADVDTENKAIVAIDDTEIIARDTDFEISLESNSSISGNTLLRIKNVSGSSIAFTGELSLYLHGKWNHHDGSSSFAQPTVRLYSQDLEGGSTTQRLSTNPLTTLADIDTDDIHIGPSSFTSYTLPNNGSFWIRIFWSSSYERYAFELDRVAIFDAFYNDGGGLSASPPLPNQDPGAFRTGVIGFDSDTSTSTTQFIGTATGLTKPTDELNGYAWVEYGGAPGSSNAIVSVYKQAATTPTDAPTAVGTYTFATNSLRFGGLTSSNGWSVERPAEKSDSEIFERAGSAFGVGVTTFTIAPDAWSEPVQIGQAGANGTNGSQYGQVNLFQWTENNTAPSANTTTLTYTFATGVVSGTPNNGWTEGEVPEQGVSDKYLWQQVGTALGTGSTDDVSTFTTPRNVNAPGSDGAQGLGAARGYIWQANRNQPDVPTGGEYSFDDDVLTPPTGWADTEIDAKSLVAGQSVWYVRWIARQVNADDNEVEPEYENQVRQDVLVANDIAAQNYDGNRNDTYDDYVDDPGTEGYYLNAASGTAVFSNAIIRGSSEIGSANIGGDGLRTAGIGEPASFQHIGVIGTNRRYDAYFNMGNVYNTTRTRIRRLALEHSTGIGSTSFAPVYVHICPRPVLGQETTRTATWTGGGDRSLNAAAGTISRQTGSFPNIWIGSGVDSDFIKDVRPGDTITIGGTDYTIHYLLPATGGYYMGLNTRPTAAFSGTVSVTYKRVAADSAPPVYLSTATEITDAFGQTAGVVQGSSDLTFLTSTISTFLDKDVTTGDGVISTQDEFEYELWMGIAVNHGLTGSTPDQLSTLNINDFGTTGLASQVLRSEVDYPSTAFISSSSEESNALTIDGGRGTRLISTSIYRSDAGTTHLQGTYNYIPATKQLVAEDVLEFDATYGVVVAEGTGGGANTRVLTFTMPPDFTHVERSLPSSDGNRRPSSTRTSSFTVANIDGSDRLQVNYTQDTSGTILITGLQCIGGSWKIYSLWRKLG